MPDQVISHWDRMFLVITLRVLFCVLLTSIWIKNSCCCIFQRIQWLCNVHQTQGLLRDTMQCFSALDQKTSTGQQIIPFYGICYTFWFLLLHFSLFRFAVMTISGETKGSRVAAIRVNNQILCIVYFTETLCFFTNRVRSRQWRAVKLFVKVDQIASIVRLYMT